ncbi:DEAD/DEAH box helicase [Evansella cellulosilytica]|uniref:Helicase domain protein n=1 Tax=Evansella cellulosilytica (strain ATCC 21833 / DSM 2522 / FERM P-1141 / JCM 9156 / N-4) TaxID=649639 RepID=E6TWZ8_EVAC2|nr:SNF2-related protein [Evansella cellulosilytica]ADU29948.1 helicase domain protein [Evansella cellulosilytica DSM 2522]
MLPKIHFDDEWAKNFLDSIENNRSLSNWTKYNMALQAGKERLIDNFHGLEATKHLPNLTIYPHQYETAQKVIEKMNGKAVLADEVGLGKTIEAGLILKEYMIRGLVKKVLILVPASLVTQWCTELNNKFFIPAIEQRKKPAWEHVDITVTSIDTAKREPHASVIQDIDYDFIIVDEAHKLKNKNTKNYQFVRSLKKKFCLLLTATPVQNRLSEVFHLISLLKPGYLGAESSFEEKYKENHEKLNELIQKVMIRNRRSDSDMDWPKRIVETVPITFTEEERALYDAVSELKNKYSKHGVAQGITFTTLTLQREVCSSRESAFMTLKNLIEQYGSHPEIIEDLCAIAEKINAVQTNSKAEQVLKLIQQSDDKVIIFTEYRATQLYLQWFLAQNGIKSVPFRGGFKRSKKDWMKQLFKDQAQVLIATEAGGEGINLQFCHRMINYDLPWNPMRIEQRIGRIHRLGQEKDVEIYNFAVKDTVEDHILKLLYKKIGLFEGVIGKLDDILEKFSDNQLEEHVSNILLHSHSEGEVRVKMDNLTSILAQ